MHDPDSAAEKLDVDLRQSRLERRFSNRPLGYPNVLVWLRSGILRDWRGAVGSLIAAWANVPAALFAAVITVVFLGIVWFFVGAFAIDFIIPDALQDTPVFGKVADAFLSNSGGIIGGFVIVGAGFVLSFLGFIVLPWMGADSPASLVAGLAGALAAAILIGVLYTLYRVLLEPRLLAVSGARRLSRREADQLIPILHDCAERLGLRNVPRLLVEDDLSLTNARTYSRHIVVTTRLLTKPPEEIAALLSHELVHWRNGDEISSAFVRGVGLPLFLVHVVPAWLMRTFPHPATNFFVYLFFWPVLLTMKYLVLPLHARDVREAEYRADAGAAAAGHADGLQALLEQRKQFEHGRSGWDKAVCAIHPPSELRLERLESVAPRPGALFGQPKSIGSRQQWVAVGVVMLVLYLVAGVLGVLQWSFFRPQAAIDGYFSALEDRKGAAAIDRLDLVSRKTAAEIGILPAIIKSPDYQPPRKVDIVNINRNGDAAFGDVSFTLDGDRYTSRLKLKRDEAATLGLFHGWSIEDGLGSFTIAGGQGDVLVNGVPVPTSQEEDYSLFTLPGVYTVTTPENPLSETTPAKVVVLPGTDQSAVTLTATLKSTVQKHVDQEIKKYLDRCAEQEVGKPTGCPFGYHSRFIESIKWEIVEYPKVEISLITPSRAAITTSEEGGGMIRATGTARDYFSLKPFEDEVYVHLSGIVYVAGDGLAVDFTK